MEGRDLIDALDSNLPVILGLFAGLSAHDARWKANTDKWSLLEILNHLADEEREDFRQRLSLTIEQPKTDWPPNDPEAKVTQRAYNERDLAESLADFRRERQTSIEYLRSLDNPDWSREHRHELFGSMSAGDLLASWAVHDLLHLKQIALTRAALTSENTKPFSTDYAG